MKSGDKTKAGNGGKIVKQKQVNFRAEHWKRIEERKAETGQSEMDAILDLVLGRDHFGPIAEAWIADQMNRTGKSRQEVIEDAVLKTKYYPQPEQIPTTGEGREELAEVRTAIKQSGEQQQARRKQG